MNALLLSLVACELAPETTTAGVEEPVVTDPASWSFDPGTVETPLLTVQDVEQALGEFVATLHDYTALPVIDGYHEVMAQADSYCPVQYPYEAGEGYEANYWVGSGCRSEHGTSFSGYTFAYRYDDYDDGAGNVSNGDAMFGQAEVDTFDGHRLRLGGTLYMLTGTNAEAGYSFYQSVLAGSFAWDGADGSSWLDTSMLPDLTVVVMDYTRYESGYTLVDGGAYGFEGAADTVFASELLVLGDVFTTCPEEPGGALAVRDGEGRWYDVAFDGASDFGQDVERSECDGCGAVYYAGQYLGDACIDFAPMASFQDPWGVEP